MNHSTPGTIRHDWSLEEIEAIYTAPLGNVLYFMPPYVITPDEVEWSIAQIVEVLRAQTTTHSQRRDR